MTEAEWLACTDFEPMLEFLQGRACERKLRLFAVGCCRQIPWLHERSWQALDVAERYADTQAGPEELDRAYKDADDFALTIDDAADYENNPDDEQTYHAALAAAWAAMTPDYCDAAEAAAHSAYYATQALSDRAERLAQARVLADVLLTSPPAVLDPLWMAWNGGIIPNLAKAIYDDRAFDRLPILADALEEAGCADRALLDHCRGPGPHVRGCWVLDLILGKS